MVEFQKTKIYTPVLLTNLSLEPTTNRREDLGKHSVYTSLPLKTEIACSVKGPKLQGPHAEDAMAKPYLVLKIFGDLITADHKVFSDNCESRNNHRYAVVVQDLATQWIQGVSVQKQNFTRNPAQLAKVPGTRKETKSHLH